MTRHERRDRRAGLVAGRRAPSPTHASSTPTTRTRPTPPAEAAPRVRVTRADRLQAGRPRLPGRRPPPGLRRRRGERRAAAGHDRRRATMARPQWSPDGRWLAAPAAHAATATGSQLALIDVDVGRDDAGRRRSAARSSCWAWSPAGDRILLAGEPDRTWQLDFFVYDVAERRAAPADRRPADACPHAGYPGPVPPSQPVWLDERRALFHAAARRRAAASTPSTAETGAVELRHDLAGPPRRPERRRRRPLRRAEPQRA